MLTKIAAYCAVARLHLVRLAWKSRLEAEERRLAEKKNIKAHCNATADKESAETVREMARRWCPSDR